MSVEQSCKRCGRVDRCIGDPPKCYPCWNLSNSEGMLAGYVEDNKRLTSDLAAARAQIADADARCVELRENAQELGAALHKSDARLVEAEAQLAALEEAVAAKDGAFLRIKKACEGGQTVGTPVRALSGVSAIAGAALALTPAATRAVATATSTVAEAKEAVVRAALAASDGRGDNEAGNLLDHLDDACHAYRLAEAAARGAGGGKP